MALALDTANRNVFELVVGAIETVDRYKRSRDRGALEGALADLQKAGEEDRNYLLPPYYMAVVEDLLGQSRDAVERLGKMLPLVETEYPFLANEMRFNLAVAQYHGYSHRHLREAVQTLDRILCDTRGLFARLRYYRLRLQSKALLAQVYAMWSIPRMPEDLNTSPDERKRIKSCYKSAVSVARLILYLSPTMLVLALRDEARFREIRAIAHNAVGMALMYYTDYFCRRWTKLRKLRSALRRLHRSEALFPRDWANYCDMGSCHMRLGYWGRASCAFDQARRYLTQVVDTLRPNYGFALYEIGRSYRIEGRFDEAAVYFTRALAVPERDREVSYERVQREVRLVEKSDSSYP
jgi:tetratricopeptide (TPR) repeat protein